MPLPCQERRNLGKLRRRFLVVASVLVSLALCSGCNHWARRARWGSGECQYDQKIQVSRAGRQSTVRQTTVRLCAYHSGSGTTAELAKTAERLEATGDAACVDAFFAAVFRGWQDIEALGNSPATDDLVRCSQLYDASLAKLLMTAQRHHRLDPASGLKILQDGQFVTIPIKHYGFAWSAEDFNELKLVGEYRLTKHARPLRGVGLGVPLVVIRHRCEPEEFFRPSQAFAATAVLRPRGDVRSACRIASEDNSECNEFVLEFYNPAHCTRLATTTGRWLLARDLTASMAWQVSSSPSNPVVEYLRPDTDIAKAKLIMFEPYQRGKIPVVFVHGLISDPTTWVTMINQLNAQSWFRERYQIWAFSYPTGMPFLVSAATLRRELNAALAVSPGAADDPAANQMVLIGHSMGGLLLKLQVTESGSAIWDLAANRPLDELRASPADRERLREVFFFEPQPFVRQVIWIGTPHRGSTLARRGVGRIGSLLARPTSEADERHRRMVAENPGVFQSWIRRRVPTSPDLLEPDSPLLVAMEKLPINPAVRLHSIIGVIRTKSLHGPGDGAVSLASAQHRCVESEKWVPEGHEELHVAQESIIEVERILQDNLLEYDLLLNQIRRRSTRISTLSQ
ncbi:MAG TPA: alpha/beta fold hydrolase [Pirellulales bacterium]